MKGLLVIACFVIAVLGLAYVLGWAANVAESERDQLCQQRFGPGWRDADGYRLAAPDCVNGDGEGKWL